MRAILVSVLATVSFSLVACSDPAVFRPAKGVKELPAAKDAYRVKEPKDGCDEIGFVVRAARIEDIATTAAAHGGTHYQVLDDFSGKTVETDTSGAAYNGSFSAHSSSREVEHHMFTARVYRCSTG